MDDTRAVVERFSGLWEQHYQQAMTMVAPDIVYRLNVDSEAMPLGGETIGWDAVNAIMMRSREVFEYLVYRPRILSVEGDTARLRVELVLRHRASGELLMVNMRAVNRVRDGMIVAVDEYVDAPMIETFMRLMGTE